MFLLMLSLIDKAPLSSICSNTTATSSRASVRELKPPLSMSITTGKKPRKRFDSSDGGELSISFAISSSTPDPRPEE